ncbi:chitotriosidase-1-like isoform X2 [Dermacentor andersoni]|uniref:chitotriosidase-1-like isoform X2 n=1 Tax=Dermacentor andersoni TaxID=34620 RepID=UPI0021558CD6|nr:chitotriosidase-1-like isoform X2 [Dermacentor andersoni]
MELLPAPQTALQWALAAVWTCCLWHSARSFQQVCYLVAPVNSSDALPIASVNVRLCSHVIMGFGTVAEDGSVDLDALGGPQALASLATLRKRRPDLKLMISIGGGGGDSNFKTMVSGADSRWRFIASAISALRAARLDGLDIDWEFPKLMDGSRFARLLKAASVEFKKDAQWPLLLSVAVPAQSLLIIGAYDVKAMARSVDFVNLMTYDLNVYNWYTPWLRHNSPLRSSATDPPYFNTLNVESSAKLWATLGMPKSKIMVGIPTYGLSWVLRDPDRWQVGSLAAGRYEYGGGFVSYPQALFLTDHLAFLHQSGLVFYLAHQICLWCARCLKTALSGSTTQKPWCLSCTKENCGSATTTNRVSRSRRRGPRAAATGAP